MRMIVFYCGLLLTIGAFSVDITLPFFTPMREHFGAGHAAVSTTVTIYIAFIGLGQILFGPLSDRIGRRPAIATGLGIYLTGSCVALLAPTIEWLLAGRAIQGFGAAVGPVVARAILRDLFSGPKLAQNLAIATGIFSLGPILAPLIGVAIAEAGGSWRSIFIGMLGFGSLLLALLAGTPETLAQRRPDALKPADLLRNARAVLGHPQSRHFLLLGPVAQCSMLTIVAGTPRVYEHEFGVTGALFALLFAIHGLGIVIGQAANHRLIARLGPVRTALAATSVMTLACALIAGFALADSLTAYRLSFFVFLFAIGFLIVAANSAAMTLDPHGPIAGFTSSFFGFVSSAAGALAATMIVAMTGGVALYWGMALLALSVLCALGLIIWLRRPAQVVSAL
jgi:MFS transporter, DHA1 family, multidrug resistance protein